MSRSPSSLRMSAAQWLQTVAQSGRVRAAAAGLVWFLMVWGALEALVAATIKATDTNEQVSGCKADNEVSRRQAHARAQHEQVPTLDTHARRA